MRSRLAWNESDLSGLRAFLDRTPTCAAAVLAHDGRDAVHLKGKLFAIPLGHLLARTELVGSFVALRTTQALYSKPIVTSIVTCEIGPGQGVHYLRLSGLHRIQGAGS